MRHHRQSRVQATIAFFIAHKHKRLSLLDVQRVAGAQHGARIKEARALGYQIDNITERVDGEVHSWYILRAEPGEAASLFPDLTPQPRYPD